MKSSQGRPHYLEYAKAIIGVIYAVDGAHRTTEVIKVGHRREVYRSAT